MHPQTHTQKYAHKFKTTMRTETDQQEQQLTLTITNAHTHTYTQTSCESVFVRALMFKESMAGHGRFI